MVLFCPLHPIQVWDRHPIPVSQPGHSWAAGEHFLVTAPFAPKGLWHGALAGDMALWDPWEGTLFMHEELV